MAESAANTELKRKFEKALLFETNEQTLAQLFKLLAERKHFAQMVSKRTGDPDVARSIDNQIDYYNVQIKLILGI